MKSDQQMYMRLDHPDLEDVAALLPGQRTQDATEETSQRLVDQALSISSRPHHMEIDAMSHPSNVGGGFTLRGTIFTP